MWFGLTYVAPGETPDAGDQPLALLSIYRPDGSRIMRIRARLESVPEVVRWVRAASEDAPRGKPPCPDCGHTFNLPDLDDQDKERACAAT